MDLSLTGTGWCLWGSEYNYDSGLIEPSKLEGMARLGFILSEIQKVLDIGGENQNPTESLVVIEDFSFASKGSSLFQIAGLGYLVRYNLYTAGIQFVLVPPTVLKKFVAGKGGVEKSVMIKEVFKHWGFDTNDDNVADAYGLARIGRSLLGWDTEQLVGYQKEALKQLEK